jgi:tetratricopeptide (TPR) repeat protein
LALFAGGPLAAELANGDNGGPRPELSEKVGVRVAKINTMMQEAGSTKNWDPLIDEAIAAMALSAPGSYDEFIMCRVLAGLYINRGEKGDFALALPLLVKMVDMPFFEKARDPDIVANIAQLYYQQDNPLEAEAYARRYLKLVPKPPADRVQFLCSLLLQRAEKQTTADKKPDPAVLAEVLELADFGLRLEVKPNERFLLIKAIVYSLLEKSDEAAEILEVLVQRFPAKGEYWLQLYGQYANSLRDLRAAMTIERAQELGLLVKPEFYTALTGHYYNLRDYGRCIELLEEGLEDGTIAQEPRNYETLAFAYIQTHRQDKAIDAYDRASKLFKTGKYDQLIAQMLFADEKKVEALARARRALEKGNIERPGALAVFAAFIAYEIQDFATARDLLAKAQPLIKEDRDRNDYQNLKRAVNESIAAEKRRAAEQAEQDAQAGKKT